MSVYRSKDRDGTFKTPFYQYDFQVAGLRFFGSTQCTSKREAAEFEKVKRAEAQAAIKAGRGGASAPMTLAEACSRYWDEVGQHAASSADIWRYLGHITRLLGRDTPVKAVSARTIAEAVSRRRSAVTGGQKKHPITAATVNRTFTEPLRRVLRRARDVWQVEGLQPIPWADIILPEPQERIREASDREETLITSAIRDDYLPAIRFALASACRLEEVVGLTWDKVYWPAGAIEITGKGRRGSPSQKRLIPITAVIRDILWPLRNNHPTAVFTYISRRRNAEKGIAKGTVMPITYQGLKTRWRRDREVSGVTDLRMHDLRHTALTRLVRATGNLKLAQQLAGHKDITTTARYAHASLDDLREAMTLAESRNKSRNASTGKRKPRK